MAFLPPLRDYNLTEAIALDTAMINHIRELTEEFILTRAEVVVRGHLSHSVAERVIRALGQATQNIRERTK